MTMLSQDAPSRTQGSVAELFLAFLKLGLTSFGGPMAHLGCFRDQLVVRRRWLSEAAYADVVALCQFLPGPASSHVGFALGLMRAGWGGGAGRVPGRHPVLGGTAGDARPGCRAGWGALIVGILHGLKIIAVAVVAQAVCGRARNLCPGRERAAIAVAAVVLMAAGAIGDAGGECDRDRHRHGAVWSGLHQRPRRPGRFRAGACLLRRAGGMEGAALDGRRCRSDRRCGPGVGLKALAFRREAWSDCDLH